jgi:hypothetical protein
LGLRAKFVGNNSLKLVTLPTNDVSALEIKKQKPHFLLLMIMNLRIINTSWLQMGWWERNATCNACAIT